MPRRTGTYLDLLSDKQEEFVYGSTAFLNVADGAVRSGKTHSALLRLVAFCRYGPQGTVMLLGKTRDTVERNVVFPLQELYPGQVSYNRGLGHVRVKDRIVHVVGANDAQAHTKIRGSTLAGAYCNELTLFPEDVLQTLIDRCSVDGAQIFADTNPDGPYHWLHKEYLDNAEMLGIDLYRFRFGLEDNPALSEEYKARIKRMHTGVWYKRMVLGLWVMAEGAIYQMFEENVHTTPHWPDQFSKVVVGIDHGTSNATAFLMAGKILNEKRWCVFREYYHDARETGRQKTVGEYAEDLKRFLKGDGYPDPYGQLYPTSIELDPSAAAFRVECHSRGIPRVRLSDNDVIEGIQVVSTAFGTEELVIHESCENTIMEAMSYIWDSKAQERGEDKPLKDGAQDHAMDALRYAMMKAIGKKGLSLVATA